MNDSKTHEAVALGLLEIVLEENIGAQAQNEKMRDPKAYVFNLYRECLAVVRERPTAAPAAPSDDTFGGPMLVE